MRPATTRGRALRLVALAAAAIAAVNGIVDLILPALFGLALSAAKFTRYPLAAATAATGMWIARLTAAGRDHAAGERT